jgi:hypothetical protein
LTTGASVWALSLLLGCAPYCSFEDEAIPAKSEVKGGVYMECKEFRKWHIDKALYFHVALEPHLKHSGSIIDRRILFLAEVQVGAAKETTTYPDDEDALCQESQRLATELLPMAMTGHPRQEGEDVMRLTCHAVPKPSEDLLQHSADAQKGGVRLWLFGSNVE